MTAWIVQLLIVLALIVALPFAIVWGRRNARGAVGGAAMMIGLAFGHLFDPARAAATESLLKKREMGEEEAEAGELLDRP